MRPPTDRVRISAARLDRHMPGWWRADRDGPINLADLTYEEGTDSILDILFPDPAPVERWKLYHHRSLDAAVDAALRRCGETVDAARVWMSDTVMVAGHDLGLAHLGFLGTDAFVSGFDTLIDAEYPELAEAWRDLIRRRRARAAEVRALVDAAAGAGGGR